MGQQHQTNLMEERGSQCEGTSLRKCNKDVAQNPVKEEERQEELLWVAMQDVPEWRKPDNNLHVMKTSAF